MTTQEHIEKLAQKDKIKDYETENKPVLIVLQIVFLVIWIMVGILIMFKIGGV